MTSPSSETRATSAGRWNLNAPRPIFLGWVGMIFIAGTGYYYVKTKNLSKRKELMRSERLLSSANSSNGSESINQDEEMRRHLVKEQRKAEGATGGSSSKRQSPLQSLLNQINRQTQQRSRVDE